MPDNPSYSMMYGLPGGFSIVMYSGTHRLKQSVKGNVHADCRVRLIVPEDMCVLWHEGTLHSGARSREDKEGNLLPDTRFFSYLWIGTLGRSVRIADGKSVYRKLRCVCEDLIGTGKAGYSCDVCREVDELTLDLTVVSSTSYAPGDVIIGDLDKVGWVVVRGVSRRMSDSVGKIMEIAETHGNWFEIDNQRGRKMMYDHQSLLSFKWYDEEVTSFTAQIKRRILKRNLPHKDYILGRFNLLKNTNVIAEDQLPHYDFPLRNLR